MRGSARKFSRLTATFAVVAVASMLTGLLSPVPAAAAAPVAPSLRIWHAMAYDAAHAQVVLFGGYDNGVLGDTWTWDGTDWTQRTPAHSPPAGYAHAMAYDAAHAQVVLFGGYGGSGNDTWTWDGTDWTQRTPAHSPSPREGHAMAYDAAHAQVVLFGGFVRRARRHLDLGRHRLEEAPSYP
jgi:hypothetical protein